MPVPKTPVVGIFSSDWHLSARAPLARTAEGDWMAAQQRVIDQLSHLRHKYGEVPIFVAGDLFDTNSQPVWFLNWLMPRLRSLNLVTVAGNHDIPSHNYTQLPRSAYWNLAEAGITMHLDANAPWHSKDSMLVVSGFSAGQKITIDTKLSQQTILNAALIHDYIWSSERTCYPGAPSDKKAGEWLKTLNRHYDAAFFGDNHIGWYWEEDRSRRENRRCGLYNCGALIRRRHDEQLLKPRVYLLHDTGVVTPHFLDTRQDVFSATAKEAARIGKTLNMDMEDFVSELARMRDLGYNWSATVRRECEKRKLSPEVQHFINLAVDSIKNQPKPE